MSSNNLSEEKNVAPPDYSWQDKPSRKSQRAEVRIINSNEPTLFDFIKLMIPDISAAPISSQLTSGARVLYISAGELEWVKEMSQTYPKSDFEISFIVNDTPNLKDFPDNIKHNFWNIQEKTMYDDSVFDYVNLDSVMLHIRAEEWPRMLLELSRIIKPGGFIELLESELWGGNMGPTNEIFVTTLIFAARAREINPRAARELGKLLKEAGYINIVQNQISVPCGWGPPIGKVYAQLSKKVIVMMFPFIMKSLGWTEERVREECSTMEREWVEFKTYCNFYKAYAQKR